MTAFSPRNTLAFRMPEAFSPRIRPTLFERLASRLVGLRERIAVAAELRRASDRDLRDMGITRYDTGRVFDPEFADEYASRGKYSRPRKSAGGS
ncbi:MAG: DUF1127 domain-containing protein [Acetobacteraceae bacterium]